MPLGEDPQRALPVLSTELSFPTPAAAPRRPQLGRLHSSPRPPLPGPHTRAPPASPQKASALSSIVGVQSWLQPVATFSGIRKMIVKRSHH